MERKVYTFRKQGSQEIKVVSRKEFVRLLAEKVYFDTDIIAGWCGIDCANYTKGESEARKLAKKGNCGLLAMGVGTFRVYTQSEWQRHQERKQQNA